MGRSLTTVSYQLFQRRPNFVKAFKTIASEGYAHGAWYFFMRSVLGSSETRTNVFSSRKVEEEVVGKDRGRSHEDPMQDRLLVENLPSDIGSCAQP